MGIIDIMKIVNVTTKGPHLDSMKKFYIYKETRKVIS